MGEPIARTAGDALVWKGVQLVGTKLIFLVRMVVLARILTPDDFGLLAIAMVAIGLSGGLTDFGMIPALVQRRDPGREHFDVAWTIGLTRALGIGIIVYLAAPLIADIFNEPRAVVLMQVLAIRPLLEAVSSIGVVNLVRNLNFKMIACIRIPEAVANTVVAIVLAPSLGVWALVAGMLAGPAATVVLSYVVAPHRPRLSFDRSTAQALIRFGRWVFVTGVIAVIGGSLLRLVISRQLGTEQLGLYFLAASFAFLPNELTSQVVGSVTFPLFARLQDDRERLTRMFRSVLTATFSLVCPVCVVLVALTPGVVEHILGPKWDGAVILIQVLAFVNIVGLLGENAGPVLNGIGRPHKIAIVEGVQTATLIGGMIILIGVMGLVGTAVAWLPAVAVSQIMVSRYLVVDLTRPFQGMAKPITAVLVASALGWISASTVYNLVSGLTGVIFGGLASGVVVAAALTMADRVLVLGIRSDLEQAFPAAFRRWSAGK